MKLIVLTLISSLFSFCYSQNTALHFDSLNTQVQTTFPGIPGGTQARTIEAWIKTTSNHIPTAGKQGVIADYGSFVTGGRFTFNILWGNAIRIEVGGNGLSGSIAVNDGNWHHVAVVYNPTATNKYSLYVDSVLDVAGNLTVTTNTSAGNLRIGRRIDGVGGFRGSIDEVRFYNYARTQAQIGGERFDEYCTLPAGLTGYFKFNEGIAGATNTGKTTAINYAGNQDATLTGFLLSGSTRNWVTGPVLTPGLNKSIYKSTLCDPITINSTTYSSTGIYYDTLTNTVSCDSMVKIDLTFVSVDDSVTKSGTKLTSFDTWATHQWIDCNNGNAPISGETSYDYTPTVSGDYAVIVSRGSCADTSDCISVIVPVSGIDENLYELVKLYPNPANNVIRVASFVDLKIISALVIDLTGKVVLTVNNNFSEINIEKLPKGMYFLELKTSKGISTKRFVKN